MIAESAVVVTQPIEWTLETRRWFHRLPLTERRRLLAEQAEQAAQYEEDANESLERELWQGGDIVES